MAMEVTKIHSDPTYGSISASEGDAESALLVVKKHHDLHPRRPNRTSNSEHSLETESLKVIGLVEQAADCPSQGHATIQNEIANVAKNLIGGGVLSLSGGVAIYADDPRAVVSATVWIILLGVFLGYFALLIAKVCCFTKAATYRECWQRSMGEHGALAVSIVNALNPAIGDLAYAAILSQTFQSLLETIGISVTRVQSLLFVTIFALLPLCLLKNLYVLAPFQSLVQQVWS
jgi:hypothetical protein